ncbi:hypothetical protein PIIN_11654 [Serendipita indica DSM 11827]|uniref:Uncharacterized protein n=1 Tax=Serendipita indica (strain DSM 11827) TaxID=1109443 RepID=G4U283_SERID|nr:hypothetical protein PIIN_11654 [Serendipita indica DSM 11827]
MRYTDYDVLILLTIILGGLCTVGFIGGVASTMTIPNISARVVESIPLLFGP